MGRFVVGLILAFLVPILSCADGEEAAFPTVTPTATQIEDQKPEILNEPENNPGPIFTGPPATPRPCPECFAKPAAKPDPGPPCSQKALNSNPDPDYTKITEPSVDGWLQYTSPNYNFSFKYPPDWHLQVSYNDVYGWAGEDGVLDAQQVQGPPTEIITLFNSSWWELIGPPETAPQIGGGQPPGVAKIEIVYGPNRGSPACQPAVSGNPKRISSSVDGKLFEGSIVTAEPPDSDPPRYSFAVAGDPNELAHVTIAAYSWGDSSNLSVGKGVVTSMGFGE